MKPLAFSAGMLVTGVVFGQETWLDCSNKAGLELKVGFDQQARWVEVRSKEEILHARDSYVTPGKVFADLGVSTLDINRVSGSFILTHRTGEVRNGECVRAAKPAAGKF